ncbi:hypothetical protein RJ639_003016 [Escallonia herrerae]|uniref:DNA-directed RNA polymerase III subunit RPC6 n=1 Tax=Escallonia herrerae TaxID=1293975 RepID=A0AA88W5W8_9ASTE|nr:hypothetical protein RJ639_003016 [Escallonia herrerae]
MLKLRSFRSLLVVFREHLSNTLSVLLLTFTLIGMSKRKRPEASSLAQSLVDAERVILKLIKSRENVGLWKGDIKSETRLPENVVTKALTSLQSKRLIKGVLSFQFKNRKHFIAAEFEPSKEVTGGSWYVDGNLDKQFISSLKELCFKIIQKHRVITGEGVHDFIKRVKATTVECTSQQISEILKSMVLDNQIIEVKSTGLTEYHSIPLGKVCYRCAPVGAVAQDTGAGAMASIPCGVCPRIRQCTPDGKISPSTCIYFKKWLDFDF